jgi:hypothetical protein
VQPPALSHANPLVVTLPPVAPIVPVLLYVLRKAARQRRGSDHS